MSYIRQAGLSKWDFKVFTSCLLACSLSNKQDWEANELRSSALLVPNISVASCTAASLHSDEPTEMRVHSHELHQASGTVKREF